MGKRILKGYKSRRNRATLLLTEEGPVVIKTFAEDESFQRELQIYKLLQGKDLPCAKVIRTDDKALVLSELPGRNLVKCLEQQEKTGQILWDVWEKLVAWLTAFYKLTGFVMTDVNLRNFLYDEKTKVLYGLDFEECSAGSMEDSAARIAAYIRTYEPENTVLKQEISRYVLNLFARSCDLNADELFRRSRLQEAMILERRKK